MNAQQANPLAKIQSKFSPHEPNTAGEVSGLDYPQWMRRCFMTGKRCIFCPEDTVFESQKSGPRERDTVFVIIPFKPNLMTFLDWSLKPYLRHFGIAQDKIRTADNFSNTGYVMCEKICLRIQQAGLVAVDLSVINRNVYYELGIAIGLSKPLLVLCDGSVADSRTDESWKPLGLSKQFILNYPSVGHLNAENNELIKHVIKVPLRPRVSAMKIVPLLVRDPEYQNSDNHRDIPVPFNRALEAAIGVAIQQLDEKVRNKQSDNALEQTFEALKERTLDTSTNCTTSMVEKLKKCDIHYLTDSNGNERPFTDIAQAIDSSLACIIDLASENPLAYFWLGYCHGRNINVIPINRNTPLETSTIIPGTLSHVDDQVRKPTHNTRDEVLAFDIRALWYMRHDETDVKSLSGKLSAVLEPILIRDVTTQQRRVFGERLTRGGQVYIYTGAVHHQELQREVVGDWDLRTASELVRYLSSADESVVPAIEPPNYAPLAISEKLKLKDVEWTDAYKQAYIGLLRKELHGKNCVIVASADVNPLTELVLAEAYKKAKDGIPPICFCSAKESKAEDHRAIVAIKGIGNNKEFEELNRRPVLHRRFARLLRKEELHQLPFGVSSKGTFTPGYHGAQRGFLIDGEPYVMPYQSQDQKERAKFDILAHLVFLRNPISPDNFIVILNGVSGPATYGLAEVLTGGEEGKHALKSEQILGRLNQAWATQVQGQSANGVEAIVKVQVELPDKPNDTPCSNHILTNVSNTDNDDTQPSSNDQIDFEGADCDIESNETNVKIDETYDKRNVTGWELYEPEKSSLPHIRIGNPRAFPT